MPIDATYPTVSMESILITATIDAHKGKNFRICDISGDFLSGNMDEYVKMALCGRLEELMVKISLQIYRHHVIYEKGRPVLYINLKKLLYGCLRPELIFHEWLVTDMRGKGFELNPYDSCVANKIIGGK